MLLLGVGLSLHWAPLMTDHISVLEGFTDWGGKQTLNKQAHFKLQVVCVTCGSKVLWWGMMGVS